VLLENKVAVITGGAGQNGLGFATARQMAAQGAKVVILDLARAEPAAAAAKLGSGHLKPPSHKRSVLSAASTSSSTTPASPSP
jgi:NAD(P)-dependent dehydrogenase (short-subunit alcohol dehydrogenase family)